MATDKLVDFDHVTDYISRDAAIDAVDVCNLHRGIIDALQAIISDIPAADVRPVVRGEWIDIRPINQSTFERIAIKGAYNKCSLCGRLCFFEENFCPKCGADMREVSEDG